MSDSLQAVVAPLQTPVRPLVEALRAYRQADADGVMVLVSRQACDEAADALWKLDALLRSMQADAVRYLVPDNNCGADWFVSRMLWHLDGPQQREAQDGVTNG